MSSFKEGYDKGYKYGRAKGLTFLDALTILFIALKLTGNIGWSWWWVLAPTWIPLAVIVVILLVGLLFWGLGKAVK